MKNIKIYWLILLITISVSFALPTNAQTKKVRKKSKVTTKKVTRKSVTPKMAVKIGTENSTPFSIAPKGTATDDMPRDSSSGSGGGLGSDNPNGVIRIGGDSVAPCTNANQIIGSEGKISGGILNGKATILPKPTYPAAAKAVRAGGIVSIQVLIDEEGNVISANATSGHPLLRAASEQAARGAKFPPTLLCGQRVKVSGIITYNFVP
jgi:TonB family protein